MSWFFHLPSKEKTINIEELEKKLDELTQEIENLRSKIQAIEIISLVIPSELTDSFTETAVTKQHDIVEDVQTFQIGDALVTNRQGFIDLQRFLRLGNNDLYIERKVPFAVLSIKSPTPGFSQ